MIHVLRECEKTKDEMPMEEFLKGDGKGCEVMKKIDRISKEKEKDMENGEKTNVEEKVI